MHCGADRFVLGLCDGNHCQSGDIGRERGNGRIVVALYRYVLFLATRAHAYLPSCQSVQMSRRTERAGAGWNDKGWTRTGRRRATSLCRCFQVEGTMLCPMYTRS